MEIISLQRQEVGKKVFQVSIDSSLLKIVKNQIVEDLGYRKSEIPEFFGGIIDEILQMYAPLIEIKAGFRILDITPSMGNIDGVLTGGHFLNLHKTVTTQLRYADKIAIFVCTIGPGMELWASRLFEEGDALRGHFVDTIASFAVEKVTDLLHEYIGDYLKEQGLAITNRFSPGYCGWSVSDQHILFTLVPKDFCGISLNPSALMTPRKSISGIIGIGKSVTREPYLCNRCNKVDCTYRIYRLLKKETEFNS